MNSRLHYSAFSHGLLSDIPLPLPECAENSLTCVSLSRAESVTWPTTEHWMEIINSQGRKVYLHSRDPFDRRGPDNVWKLTVEDVTTFCWNDGKRRIEYLEAKTGQFCYWLLHLALPLFLRLEQQVLMMHSAGIAIDGRAVVFGGGSFSGKSTLANSLLEAGYPFMADDKLGLFMDKEELHCTSSYPYCRNYRATEDLGRTVEVYQQTALELSGIYILERADPAEPVLIQPLEGYTAFGALQLNLDLPLSFLRQQAFSQLGEICRLTPVFKLVVPWSRDIMGEVVDAIIGHQAQVKPLTDSRHGSHTD